MVCVVHSLHTWIWTSYRFSCADSQMGPGTSALAIPSWEQAGAIPLKIKISLATVVGKGWSPEWQVVLWSLCPQGIWEEGACFCPKQITGGHLRPCWWYIHRVHIPAHKQALAKQAFKENIFGSVITLPPPPTTGFTVYILSCIPTLHPLHTSTTKKHTLSLIMAQFWGSEQFLHSFQVSCAPTML